jgi:hemerythrin-like metal-binding protein
MRQNNYPGFQEQKDEHDKFIKIVNDFRENYLKGGKILSVEITEFIINWIQLHIKNMDKRYGSFLTAKKDT